MIKKRRVVHCVILSRFHKPAVVWRFFRRRYFYRFSRAIERLPGLVMGAGRRFHG